jgi:hypothetical protein
MTDPPYPTGPYGAGSPQPEDRPPPGYGGPPPGGYAVPPQVQDPTLDPLVSPDYAGWWQRGTSITKRGLVPLAQLQAIGMGAGLLVQIPLGIYIALLTRDIDEAVNGAGPDSAAAPDLGPIFGVFGLGIVTVFVAIVIAAIVTIASVHVGVMVATGVTPSLGTAIRSAAGRAFPLLGWQLLAGLVILAGLCACVLPAIYLVGVFTVLPVVVAVERGGVIGRCFKLFHGDLGASIARIATVVGLSIGVSAVGGILGALVETALQSNGGLILGSVFRTMLTVGLAAGLALVTAPLTLAAYADMRARVEPLNTAMLAQELGITPPPPQPSPWGA